MQPTKTQRLAIAALSIALGAFLLLVASALVPGIERQAHDAPNTIIALAGLVFVIAGCMARLGQQSRVNDLLAAILLPVFGVIAAWVAWFSPSEGFSGGVPLVSDETNVSIARAFFGMGALLCFAMTIWALRRFIRSLSRTDDAEHH